MRPARARRRCRCNDELCGLSRDATCWPPWASGSSCPGCQSSCRAVVAPRRWSDAVFASGLLAKALIRSPAGWAADRFGTRPVMIVSLASEAVLFLGYLPHLPLAAFIALRFVHGAAAGPFWAAAHGLIRYGARP